MKYVIFVEGHTEEDNLPDFIGRWFNTQKLSQTVRIEVVRFAGCTDFYHKAIARAQDHLNAPDNDKIIGVIGLLDLYGPRFYPEDKNSIQERYEWAVAYFEKNVKHDKFRMFMAVHELEAWLLSQPEIFDQPVYKALKNEERQPETINFDKPPKKLLHELYCNNMRKGYIERVYGYHLFRKLDPSIAYEKCPYLKIMLDEMLKMAQKAGLSAQH